MNLLVFNFLYFFTILETIHTINSKKINFLMSFLLFCCCCCWKECKNLHQIYLTFSLDIFRMFYFWINHLFCFCIKVGCFFFDDRHNIEFFIVDFLNNKNNKKNFKYSYKLLKDRFSKCLILLQGILKFFKKPKIILIISFYHFYMSNMFSLIQFECVFQQMYLVWLLSTTQVNDSRMMLSV